MLLIKDDICKFVSVSNSFENRVFCISAKYTHVSNSYVRAIKPPFMTKEMHKAIMKISKLKSSFFNWKTFPDRTGYITRRNYWKTYLNNLDITKVTDN